MDVVQLKFNNPDGKTGYRDMPAQIMHPRFAPQLTSQAFDALVKQKIISTPKFAKGHAGTDVWYSGSHPDHFYVLQIKFEKRLFTKTPDLYYRSMCTFIPTFGVDVFDGWFCCDIEEFVLLKTLKRPTDRLNIFGEKDSVPLEAYLKFHGFPPPPA